jgi:hypothetical protein
MEHCRHWQQYYDRSHPKKNSYLSDPNYHYSQQNVGELVTEGLSLLGVLKAGTTALVIIAKLWLLPAPWVATTELGHLLTSTGRFQFLSMEAMKEVGADSSSDLLSHQLLEEWQIAFKCPFSLFMGMSSHSTSTGSSCQSWLWLYELIFLGHFDHLELDLQFAKGHQVRLFVDE